MDQEISKGTWVGATILAIVAILGLAFAVYGISRTLVNNSSSDFVQTLDTVSTSAFNDFDGTVVSGLQVRNAIETYEGEKIAIFVSTVGSVNAYKNNSNSVNNIVAKLVRNEAISNELWLDISSRPYACYNAIPKMAGCLCHNSSGAAVPATSWSGTLTYVASKGWYEFAGDFVTRGDLNGGSDTTLVYNNIKVNYKTVGNSEHIANGTNFGAKLIKDTAGTVVGLVFTQILTD